MKYDNVTFFRYAVFVRDAQCCPDSSCDEIIAQATLAINVVDNGKYNIAAAIICNDSDNFNKNVGRELAHKKMLAGEFLTIDQQQIDPVGIVYAYGQALQALKIKLNWLPTSLTKKNVRIASRIDYF